MAACGGRAESECGRGAGGREGAAGPGLRLRAAAGGGGPGAVPFVPLHGGAGPGLGAGGAASGAGQRGPERRGGAGDLHRSVRRFRPRVGGRRDGRRSAPRVFGVPPGPRRERVGPPRRTDRRGLRGAARGPLGPR